MNLIKSLSTVFLICVVSAVSAQPTKGSFMVSGSISYKSVNEDKNADYPDRSRSFSITPNVSYFISKRWAGGLYLPYRREKRTLNDGSGYYYEGRSNYHAIGPAIRYYQPLDEKLYGIVHVGYTWDRFRSKSRYKDSNGYVPSDKISASFTTLALGLGATYFVNSNIGIELMANFKHNQGDSVSGSVPLMKTRAFNISLGLQVYLTRKQE